MTGLGTKPAPGTEPAESRPAAFFYVVAAAVLVIDQITKLRIVQSMSRGESRRVLGDFFRITYVHNDGAAFGLDLGGRWSFIIVTVLVAAFILFYYARSERAPIARWALALILGGALGNLADRIRIGEVVDFFHVSVAGFSWPIFNVADIGVSVGVGLLALHLFRKEVPENADGPSGAGAEAADPHGSAGGGGPA
jgi:signal peptidase II